MHTHEIFYFLADKSARPKTNCKDYARFIKKHEEQVKKAMNPRSQFVRCVEAELGNFNIKEPFSKTLNSHDQIDCFFNLLLKHDFLVEIYLNAFQMMSADSKVIDIMTEAMKKISLQNGSSGADIDLGKNVNILVMIVVIVGLN